MFWRRKKADKEQKGAAKPEIKPAVAPNLAVFDFGGEARPGALFMRGFCRPSEQEEGLQACQWVADENPEKKAVPRYFIEF